MSEEDVEVLEVSKAVNRLYGNKDFQKVILELYIDKQVISLGTDFDGLEDELDTLKAITHLKRFLDNRIDEGIIVVQNNKG